MAVRYTSEDDIEVRKTSNGYNIYKNGVFQDSKFTERGVSDWLRRDEFENCSYDGYRDKKW